MPIPVRRAAGTSAHGAGAPGRQVGGRGITWGGTGRDIARTLPAACSPSAGQAAVATGRRRLATLSQR